MRGHAQGLGRLEAHRHQHPREAASYHCAGAWSLLRFELVGLITRTEYAARDHPVEALLAEHTDRQHLATAAAQVVRCAPPAPM